MKLDHWPMRVEDLPPVTGEAIERLYAEALAHARERRYRCPDCGGPIHFPSEPHTIEGVAVRVVPEERRIEP